MYSRGLHSTNRITWRLSFSNVWWPRLQMLQEPSWAFYAGCSKALSVCPSYIQIIVSCYDKIARQNSGSRLWLDCFIVILVYNVQERLSHINIWGCSRLLALWPACSRNYCCPAMKHIDLTYDQTLNWIRNKVSGSRPQSMCFIIEPQTNPMGFLATSVSGVRSYYFCAHGGTVTAKPMVVRICKGRSCWLHDTSCKRW